MANTYIMVLHFLKSYSFLAMTVRDFIIILTSFCICCSCEKGSEQQGGPADKLEGMPVCLTLPSMDLITWDKDDVLMLRWMDRTYPDASEGELLSSVESGGSVRFEGRFSEYKETDLFAYHAAEGTFVSKTSVAFRGNLPSKQTGRLEDISDYAILYSVIKKGDFSLESSGDKVTAMNITGTMQPFYAVLKIAVPSSLGYTQLKMEASSAVAGHVQLNPQKTWGSLGSDGFAYRPTGTGAIQKTSIVVSDNGRVLGDDVYIVIAPNLYDAAEGNYCSTAQSLKFTLTGPSGDVTFEKSLDKTIFCGELMDLGSVPGRSIQVALKVTDYNDSPTLVLDSLSVANSISYGARYYFITGEDGFDNLPEPTDSDAPLATDGISIPVQNKSDRLYIKVLGRCEGCDDVALKAIVRNWKYDINYISPTELHTEYDGLDLQISKAWSDEMCTDGRIGYLGCQAGKAVITPELRGTGWLNANFFAGSFATTFKMLNGTRQLYKIDMPAQTYYSDNDIMKSVRLEQVDPSQKVVGEWSYRIWLRNMIFLEQEPYIPVTNDVGNGNVGIEDFDGNINYQ